ncbi:MAG: thiamine pyrophosphate-dependent enzyme [Halobacteriales archaeon]
MASELREVHGVMASERKQPPRGRFVDLYRQLVLARRFDEKAVRLNRQGRLGTYAPLAGHEAIQVGAATALRDDDWLFPTYRDHAMYLTRGFDLVDVIEHLDGRGNYHESGGDRTLPPAIPVATQLLHAVGAGMAADYADDDAAAVVSFGDGATSEGDFHEAMNFAGVFEAPAVFLCQNNRYAISVPFERQTATDTVAEKARAYGFDGVRVDGSDVLAVRDAVREALGAARTGEGPTLIEAVNYRRGAHTTTDDPGRYREEDEREEWPDPIERTREHLRTEYGWTDEEEQAVVEWADDRVAAAVDSAESGADPAPESMFDHVKAAEHRRLARQRGRLVDEPELHD